MTGRPGDAGVPGRYCPPAICWCKKCDWWKPRTAEDRAASTAKPKPSSWDDREESTWIDKL